MFPLIFFGPPKRNRFSLFMNYTCNGEGYEGGNRCYGEENDCSVSQREEEDGANSGLQEMVSSGMLKTSAALL